MSTSPKGSMCSDKKQHPTPNPRPSPKRPLSKNTLYRRHLPETCTAFSSPHGRVIFSSALHNNGLKSFFPLVEQYTTQAEPAYCGISTLIVVLNALSVDPRRRWNHSVWRWYGESMLNCCVDLEQVKETGITFRTFHCLAVCQGLTSQSQLASATTVDEFRTAVRKACCSTGDNPSEDEPDLFLVISYSRQILQQTGIGHFSPVAAYDESSDAVLILDVARFKYGSYWVPLPLIFETMLPVDPDTGDSRGYVLLSFDNDDGALPHISMLFRSSGREEGEAVRRGYKLFLKERRKKRNEISSKDVVEYWTKGGEDYNFVWKIISPQLCPLNETEQKLIDDVLTLLRGLVSNNSDFMWTSLRHCGGCETPSQIRDNVCHKSAAREIRISSAEAAFVVYLASLPRDERRGVVESSGGSICGGDSDPVIEQLLSEAELISVAIEMSDQFD